MRIENDYPACELLFDLLANQISLKKIVQLQKKTFEAKLTTPIKQVEICSAVIHL